MSENSLEGERARDEFHKVANDTYKRLCADDGRMDKKQLRAYLDHMDEHTVKIGLKGRKHTDEYHEMVWECIKGYKPDNERRTQSELNFIFKYICPEMKPHDRFYLLSAKCAIQDEEFKEIINYRSEEAGSDPRIEAESIRLIKIYRPLRALIQMYELQFDSKEEESYFYLKQNNDDDFMTLNDAFNNSDQDGDGRLNRYEFEAFYRLLIQSLKNSQEVVREVEISEHFYNNYYAGCNEYEPSAEGVSFEEFQRIEAEVRFQNYSGNERHW